MYINHIKRILIDVWIYHISPHGSDNGPCRLLIPLSTFSAHLNHPGVKRAKTDPPYGASTVGQYVCIYIYIYIYI